MANKELLITGTDGFVGGYLRSYFQNEGYDVYGTVFNMRAPEENECVVDFCKDEDFKKIPEKDFEVIINVAGIVDQTVPKKLMMEVNAEGTRRMCEWAKKHNCKHFIQISSVSAYGFRMMGEHRTEKKAKRNWGIFGIPYMQSKAKAERYIEKSGVNYTLLRFPPILGENDSYITPTIVPRLLKGTLYFCGKKDRLYSTFNIKNMGSLISKIIEVGNQNDAYNCTDFEMTWRAYVEDYARQLNVEVIDQYVPIKSIFKHWDDKKYCLMVSYCWAGAHYPNAKLLQLIDWSPPYSWQDGVKDAIKGYFATCSEEEKELMKKAKEIG